MIIKREVEIIEMTNCNYTVATISDWFDLLCESMKVPDWTNTCYLHAPFTNSEDLTRIILKVVDSNSFVNPTSAVLKVIEIL